MNRYGFLKNEINFRALKFNKTKNWGGWVLLGIMLLSFGLAYAKTYRVDNLGDTDDGGGYTLGTNTLRKCVRLVNNNIGADTITFLLTSKNVKISPLSALPEFTDDSTLISAASNWHGSSPGVTIDGASAGSYVTGFTINGANSCSIRGLSITNFTGSGIAILNGAQFNTIGGSGTNERNIISNNDNNGVYIGGTGTNNNVVKNNYIGTDANGTSAQANSRGVTIEAGAQNNTIGGSAANERNLIAGSINYGIYIGGTNTNSNVVKGNYIGTDVNGTAPLPNSQGVHIEAGAQSNTIGGSTAGERNIISGNTNYGIYITDPLTNSNIIKGNYIGTDVNGTAVLANKYGVNIAYGAQNNIVGGSTAGERNIISGNTSWGVYIRNTNTNYNVVKGNYIGTDASGTTIVANFHGVYLSAGAQSNTIGGSSSGERNVISGNSGNGVYITGTSTNNNIVKDNYIGTNANGTAALPNNFGIAIDAGAESNTIGGSTEGERNIISGNLAYGIYLSDNKTSYNVVKDNYIGTTANGTVALANYHGIYIEQGAQNNTIGGSNAGDRNIISGNTNYAVYIGDDGTDNNTVIGNYIGTNPTGTAKLPNGYGVYIILGAQGNTIGGSTVGARNIISGNINAGVFIGDPYTNYNVIRNNYIGTDTSGTLNLGNGGAGIRLENGTQRDTIGGTSSGFANVIAFNGGAGVSVVDNSTRRMTISGNSMFENVGLGIDLGDNGPSANDNQYSTSLPDSGLDFPVIDSAYGTDSTFHVLYVSGYIGTSRSAASTNTTFANCRVEIYKADPDPAGYGEGKIYLGYLTSGSSNSLFSGYLDVFGNGLTKDDTLTAITIDIFNNTSEFSPTDSVYPTSIVVSSFTAQAESNLVLVRWETESQVDIAGFNLYRSLSETIGYTKITESLIPVQGDPIAGAVYEFPDSVGELGNYYKLEVVTLTGGSIFYGPIKAETEGAEEIAKGPQVVPFAIIPNPVLEKATIRYYVPGNRRVILKIYDVTGRQVCVLTDEEQKPGSYHLVWDAKRTGSGVYFISLTIAGEKTKVKKAIVLR